MKINVNIINVYEMYTVSRFCLSSFPLASLLSYRYILGTGLGSGGRDSTIDTRYPAQSGSESSGVALHLQVAVAGSTSSFSSFSANSFRKSSMNCAPSNSAKLANSFALAVKTSCDVVGDGSHLQGSVPVEVQDVDVMGISNSEGKDNSIESGNCLGRGAAIESRGKLRCGGASIDFVKLNVSGA